MSDLLPPAPIREPLLSADGTMVSRIWERFLNALKTGVESVTESDNLRIMQEGMGIGSEQSTYTDSSKKEDVISQFIPNQLSVSSLDGSNQVINMDSILTLYWMGV